MPSLSKLESSPRKAIEQIALSLVGTSFLGPPANLLNLILVSKTIWNILAPERNRQLYARIFGLKFDARAATRRLGDDCEHTNELAEELIRRCIGLKRLKQGVYPRPVDDPINTLPKDDGCLRVDLWMAYLMFMESDGKNAKQLIHYARVDRLAFEFIKPGGRFHDGKPSNGGWTVDNEVNALTAWIFWFTDKDRVDSETQFDRQSVLEAFAHVFVGSFKVYILHGSPSSPHSYFGPFQYASAHAPITSFLIPPTTPPSSPTSASALPLAGSPLPPPCTIPDHFGFEVILACPLLTPAALLSCVVRLEKEGEAGFALPHHMSARMGNDAAIEWRGSTTKDYQDEQNQIAKMFADWDADDRASSHSHEDDWMRLRTCYDPWSYPPMRDRVFTPGMLDGSWVGRWFGIPVDEFTSILDGERAGRVPAAPQLPVYSVPMQFHIREHHQHKPADMVDFDDISCDGTGQGVFNAWLPEGTTMSQKGGELKVYDPQLLEPSTYRTYDPSTATSRATLDTEIPHVHEGLYGQGVWDIILTAETDEVFGNAWGHKRYNGRVRDWDGLVVLVRDAMDGEGQWIFRGYVHGKRCLVGRWRETTTPVGVPGWEGVWSMTKKEE